MSYSKDTLHNTRRTPEGSRADAATRRASGSGDGRVAGHRHPAANGAPPDDRANIYRQNANQNIGTKAYVEEMNRAAVRQDPALTVTEQSHLVKSPGRPGFGPNTPIAEGFTYTYSKDGKTLEKKVTFANTPSSASREAERLAAQGKTLKDTEAKRLHALDRKNIGATTREDQKRAFHMNQERAAAPDRHAMAQRLAVQQPGSNVVPLHSAPKHDRKPGH